MADRYALEARHISKWFGAQQALKDIGIALRAGEIHAVIGENGAGKSTLMNVLCGKLVPDEGELRCGGEAVQFATPMDAQRAGIIMAPQELTLCPLLSVAENILLGAQPVGSFGIDWSATRRLAAERLANLDDSIDPDTAVRELSAARQQLVQIARATPDRAKCIILDEPTASLTPDETERLFRFVDHLRNRGCAIFYISHRLDEILQLADRISVLRDGVLVAELDPRSTDKDEMIRHMAGRVAGIRARIRTGVAATSPVVLEAEGLTRAGEFADISFDLHEGEILGVSGLIGAGRTEVGKCIFGVTQPDSGTIRIDGRPVRHRFPADAIANGLVYLPEDRKKEGIFPVLSVAENLCAAELGAFRDPWGLNWRRVVAATLDYARRLGIRIGSPRLSVSNLSGGNQQKVILARWLLGKCRILVLDEPTRGIDVNAKAEIQALLRDLASQGLSIVYISSELQELLDVSDRILIMHDGRRKGLVEAAGLSQEELLRIGAT